MPVLLNALGHIALALAIQFLVDRLTRSRWAGAMAAIAWAVSREITQAEYRWIEHLGGGLRANMPWWGGLDLRVWGKADPWLDFLLPSAAVIVAALYHSRHKPS